MEFLLMVMSWSFIDLEIIDTIDTICCLRKVVPLIQFDLTLNIMICLIQYKLKTF